MGVAMSLLVLAFLGLLAAYLLYTGVQFLNLKNWSRGFIALASSALLVLSWFHITPRLGADSGELERLKPELAKFETAAKSSSLEVTDLKAKLDAQGKLNATLTSDKAAFEAASAKLKAEADTLRSDWKVLNGRIEELTAAKAQLQAQLDTSAKAKPGNDTTSASLKAELDAAKGERTGLLARIEALSKSKSYLSSSFATLSSESNAARSDRLVLLARIDELGKSKAVVEGSLGLFRTQLVSANSHRLELMGKVNGLGKAQMVADSSCATLKTDAESANQERLVLLGRIDELGKAKGAIEGSLGLMRTQLVSANTHRMELMGKINGLGKAQMVADASCTTMKSDADAAKQDRMVLLGRIDELSKSKSAIDGSLGMMRTQLVSANSHRLDLMGRVRGFDKVKADYDACTLDRQALKGQYDTLAQAKSAIEGSMGKLRTELVSANSHRLVLMGQLRVPAAVSVVAVAAPPKSDLSALKAQYESPVLTSHYNISLYPDEELVKGKKGRYYLIDVKNSANGLGFKFDGGRYVIDRNLPEFKTSIDMLVQELVSKLDGKVDYQFMARGRADNSAWKGRFAPGHVYSSIKYLPSTKDAKYDGAMTEETLDGRKLGNQNLPNLRGEFMSRLVGQAYPAKAPIVLQGVVSPQQDSNKRGSELILYVGW
jgi:ribonuclease HI